MFDKLRKNFKENKRIISDINTHITKEDIEHLAYIWDTQSKEIIDTINNRTNSYMYISQENLRLLLNKLYENTQELSMFASNNLDND